eukprot:scaffold32_cov190-Alexandrium_tamarense.AAC.3
MIRRTIPILSSKGRTIIRDPRKVRTKRATSAVVNRNADLPLQHQSTTHVDRPRMAFEPSTSNQQSLGLGSYVLAGAGVTIGVAMTIALFGAIG